MKSHKPEVAICWHHQLNYQSDYDQRIREISNYWTRQLTWQTSLESIFEGEDLEELISKAQNSGARYMLLVQDGQLIRSSHFLRDCIAHLSKTGHIALGHLLAKPELYPSLHLQCFFADLSRINLVSVLQKALQGSDGGPFIRSGENIHDDYTPLFIAPDLTPPADESKVASPDSFESSLLAELLKIGPVSNFTQELRHQKLHLYPENNPDQFWNSLKGEANYKDVDLDPGQNFYLDCHQLARTREKIFVFNTEILDPPQTTPKPLGHLYSVAAGFRPYVLLKANGFSVGTKVTYFDYGKHSLMLKQYLVENWDGEDYLKACESFLKDTGLPKHAFHDVGDEQQWTERFNEVVEKFGTMDDWLSFWQRYRVLDHDYLHVNLFEDPEVLTQHIRKHAAEIDPETLWVWWSNCFYTEVGVVNYGVGELREKFISFFSKLYNISPNIFGDGGNHDQLTWVARLKDMPFAQLLSEK